MASSVKDATVLQIHGDNIRKYLSHGDLFRVGGDEESKFSDGSEFIGHGNFISTSPLISNINISKSPMVVGQNIRINGDEFTVKRNGVEIHQITLHKGLEIHEDSNAYYFFVNVTVNGRSEASTCIHFMPVQWILR